MANDFYELYKKCKEATDQLLEAAGEDQGKQKKAIAQKIKIYRAGNNLTQEGLAKKIGVTKMQIIRWENEKNMPSQLAIDKMKQEKIL